MSALRIIVPLVLGIAAAILNFMVLRGSTAELELIALSDNIKAGTVIDEDMLGHFSVRADKEVFRSAVQWKDRGVMLGRRVTRDIDKDEVLLYADVHNLEEENIREDRKLVASLTFSVKSSRIAPGLRRGDPVGVVVSLRPAPELTKTGMRMPTPIPRMLGPFRLLSVGAPVDSSRGAGLGDTRTVLVATVPGPKGQLDRDGSDLLEAITAGASGGNSGDGGVLAVEYYKKRP